MGRRRKKYDYRNETPYDRYMREQCEPRNPGLEFLNLIGSVGFGFIDGIVMSVWAVLFGVFCGFVYWLFN